jgi:hypothetical protein
MPPKEAQWAERDGGGIGEMAAAQSLPAHGFSACSERATVSACLK